MTARESHPEQDPAEGSRSTIEKQLRKEQGGEAKNREAKPTSDKSGSKASCLRKRRRKAQAWTERLVSRFHVVIPPRSVARMVVIRADRRQPLLSSFQPSPVP